MRISLRTSWVTACVVVTLCAILSAGAVPTAHAQAAGDEPPATAAPAKPGTGPTGKQAGEKPAAGKTATPPPASLTVEELETFVKTIEDKTAREAFVKQLKTLIALRQAQAHPPAERPGFLAGLARSAEKLSGEIVKTTKVLVDAPRLWAWVKTQYNDAERRRRWVNGLWKTIVAIAAGLIAELLMRLLLARPRRRIEARQTGSLPNRLGYLALRTILDLIPMGAFAAAAYGVLPLLEPSVNTSLVALTLIYANVLVRAIRGVARAVLAPRAPSLRVAEISNETAVYLFVWIKRITNFTVYGYFILEAALFFGLPKGGHTVLLRLLGFVVTAMVIVFIVQNRTAVADWLRGQLAEEKKKGPVFRLRGRFAEIWHILMALYVAAAYIVWVLGIDGGFQFMLRATVLTLVVFIAWGLAIVASSRVITRMFHIDEDLKQAYPHLEERANRYIPVVRGLMRGAIAVVTVILLLQVWRIDVMGWLATEFGSLLLVKLLTILAILIGAAAIWEIASFATERLLAQHQSGSVSRARKARMNTLLPLARKVLLIVLVIMVSLIILSELGVNIGPLLAGAGVLGLAIGFGAQTLVKDLITGLFNLIEDTIAVGDNVEIAGHGGTVESVSIRSVRLRDYSGTVHTVPFSEVSSVKNNTKGFSYAVIEVGVGYRENVDDVMETLREIDAEFQADPDFKKDLTGPLDLAGLQSLDDSAVVIRGRIRTKPGKQWGVRREFQRRMKAVFDARGIEIPYPHTTIYFGEDKEGKAPPAHVRMLDEGATSKPKAKPKAGPAKGARAPKPQEIDQGPAEMGDDA